VFYCLSLLVYSPFFTSFFCLVFYCLFPFFGLVFYRHLFPSFFTLILSLFFWLIWFHLWSIPTCFGLKGLVVVNIRGDFLYGKTVEVTAHLFGSILLFVHIG
jgi:hypothetical protein